MRQFLESNREKFSLNFTRWRVNFKMASPIGGGRGGKRINSGRKRIFKGYLKMSLGHECESMRVSL